MKILLYIALCFVPMALAAKFGWVESQAPPGYREHYSREEREAIKDVFRDLGDSRRALVSAEARISALLRRHCAPYADQPDPDPEPELRPLPGFADVPFAVPPIPSYTVPSLEDCEWIIQDGVATSTQGLPSLSLADGYRNLIAPAYRASIAAGHELPITVGLWDDTGGKVYVGGLYNTGNDFSIAIKDEVGEWMSYQLEVLGLDDDCELEIGWTTKWGRADYVGLFNVGIRAPNDSFVIRANDGIGNLIVDGCWWLPNINADGTPAMHASGMHIDKWETLVWANHQYKGTLLREHSAYLKSCVGDPEQGGGTWIIGNDLRGGNRTGFQIRPQASDNPRPRGPIVIAYNKADGYGFTHGEDPSTKDGGGCLTVWVGPESPVYVIRNEITDARYGCLVVSGQATDRNWTSSTGYPIEAVRVFENVFRNPRADRSAVSISATEWVHIYSNEISGPANGELVLDNPWNLQKNGIRNGSVFIHGRETLNELAGMDVRGGDPSKPIPAEMLESYLVPGTDQ